MARATNRFRSRSRKNASPPSARSTRRSRCSSARRAAFITVRSTTSRSACTTCGTGSKTYSSRGRDAATSASRSFRCDLARNRLTQDFPCRLRAVELTQDAAFDLPSLRAGHELPAVRRHWVGAKAFGAAVVRYIDRIALRLRHQDLQIGGDDGAVALYRARGQ